jgi:uncharacterized membrane protein
MAGYLYSIPNIVPALMAYQPSPSRLEAFSDGVIAVIITIMVLDFKVPKADGIAGLLSLAPTLAVYALSFAFTGIYWVNHHHLIDRLKKVDHLILWANLGFLFCLSLLPFCTAYMVDKHLDSFSVAVYAGLSCTTGLSFSLLQKASMRRLRHTAETDPEEIAMQAAEVIKGKISLGVYLIAMGLAYVRPALGLGGAALVTVLWIVPTLGLGHHEKIGDRIEPM